jgi:hypothetical protein
LVDFVKLIISGRIFDNSKISNGVLGMAADEDRLEALRLVALFLLHTKKSKVTVVGLDKSLEQKCGDAGVLNTFQSFLDGRKNAGIGKFTASYPDFRDVLSAEMHEREVRLPRYMHDLAIMAGVLERDTSRIPNFIDTSGLLEASGGIAHLWKAIRAYQGCWRTYRISSRTIASDALINVGFLNIRPFKSLPEGDVPQFSYFQCEDSSYEPSTHVSRSYGVVVHTAECISLLGERSKETVGVGYLHQLTWRHVVGHNPAGRPIFGVWQGPNSEASRIIGAHCVAAFIDGSGNLSKEEYDALKEKELDDIGASPWTELKKGIRSQAVVDEIERMIGLSKDNSIFRI